MSNKPRIWGFVLLLLIFLSVANTSYCKKSSKEVTPEKKIHMFIIAMDNGIIEKKALSELRKLTRSKDPAIKSRAIGLLAQYEGEGTGNLIKALTILIPYVLDKKEADSFKRKLIGGKDDKEFLNAIPPASKWKFKEPELCVSMGRILAFGKKYSEALAAFDRVGKNKEGVPRVMAAEGIGDMQFALKRWKECIGSYQFALKSISYLKKLYKYEESTPDPIINALSQRISRKLNEAKRKWDEERYGPGFVAYREARQKQFGKDYLTAVVLYDRIKKDFPVTVYSEAAGLYGPQCLFKLALPGKDDNMEKTLDNLKDTITSNKKKLRKFGKLMTIRVRERLEKQIAKDEAYYKELKEVPTGKKAEEKAIADLEAFITSKPEGLYRGEAYLEIATHMMEQKFDPDKTEEALIKAEEWFENSDKINKAMAKITIPSKASWIATPPQNVATKDTFGNTNKIKISHEKVVNRNTCPWYMDSLKTKLYRMKGFIAFYKGEKEKALENYGLMKKYDRLNRIYESQGDWGDYKRLVWGAEHGYFYSQPTELKNFGEKTRFLVLVGDYYYITMQFKKAAEIHKRVLNGELGNPSKYLKAYSHFMCGSCLYWEDKRPQAFEEYKKAIALNRNSYTGEKAMFAAGQLGTDYMGSNIEKERRESYKREGFEMLEHLATKGKNRDWMNQAKISLAMSHYTKGNKIEAEKMIKSISAKTPEEKKIVNTYLNIIKK